MELRLPNRVMVAITEVHSQGSPALWLRRAAKVEVAFGLCRTLAVALFWLGLIPWLAACGAASGETPNQNASTPAGVGTVSKNRTELVVFAAASLIDPFEETGRQFEEENPAIKVIFNFAGSQQLSFQLEQGAKADVFASANMNELEKVQATNLAGQARLFAHNKLVVIVPKDNSGRISGLMDLAGPGLKLVVAQRGVPAGDYTLDVLNKVSVDPHFDSAFKTGVVANIRSEEDNVKKVVTKVLLGEADAGIIYASDVTEEVRPGVKAIPIPSPFNVVADYPIATLREAQLPGLAERFIEFVLSAQGQAILISSDFDPASL